MTRNNELTRIHPSEHWASLPLMLAAALIISISGCGDDDGGSGRFSIASRGAPAPSYTKQPSEAAGATGAARTETQESTEEETADYSSYEHEESTQFRDPFHSFLEEFQKKAEGPLDDEVGRSPLEMFDVGEYTLIAVITGTPVPKAMITDPTGFGHVVRPGDRIGKQGGRVAAIYSNEVVIRTPNPRMGDEETFLRLYPPDEVPDQYELNVVESAIETEAFKTTKSGRLPLKQLDLRAILGGRAGPLQAEGREGQTQWDQPQEKAAGLPAIPVVPLLPGFMMKSPGEGGGVGTPGTTGAEAGEGGK